MKTFPAIRDLVTDVSWNYRVNEQITPFTPRTDREWKWYQHDDRPGAGDAQVHRVLHLPGRLPHPARSDDRQAAVLRAALLGPLGRASTCIRWTGSTALGQLSGEGGIGLCNITKCCTEVCPEGIHITDNAIIPMKERVVDAFADPLRSLWRRLFGRKTS